MSCLFSFMIINVKGVISCPGGLDEFFWFGKKIFLFRLFFNNRILKIYTILVNIIENWWWLEVLKLWSFSWKKMNHELLFVIMVKKSTEGKFTNKHFRMFKRRGEGTKQIKENSVHLSALLTIRSFNKYWNNKINSSASIYFLTDESGILKERFSQTKVTQ